MKKTVHSIYISLLLFLGISAIFGGGALIICGYDFGFFLLKSDLICPKQIFEQVKTMIVIIFMVSYLNLQFKEIISDFILLIWYNDV
ncbi:hypothetical protein [Chryseobacterium lineare]